jgi:GntR family transcriptional regulator
MQIHISAGSPQSIYRQIADQIRQAIVSGNLRVGDSVPSVRQLAKELAINPNTVAKAYAELTRDGVLEGQSGRGCVVASRKNVFSKAERIRRLELVLDSLVSEALTLGFSCDEIQERLVKRFEKIDPEQKHVK